MTASTTEELVSTPESANVCVVGQGYVGLPLALAFDEEGHDVAGFDIDDDKIAALDAGKDVTGDFGDDRIGGSAVDFTTDAAAVADATYVIVTVPTPVDEMGNPNLDYVKGAAETVGKHLTQGSTVVLESTVFPGVTRDVVGPIVERESGLDQGEGFTLGYSPERLSPGDEGRGLRDVKKIVSGSDERTLAELSALYGSVVDAGIYEAPSIETAEAAKVMENVQRDLNIALVNELSLICERMDLDTQAVLDAAGTKWNFHDYHPGLVGGHCIPVDPMYMAYGAERAGYQPKLIMQGREINEYMPKHVAELAIKALNAQGKVLGESSVLVLGLSYKANVGDIRTSEVKGVISELQDFDMDVVGYDPHADDEACEEYFGCTMADDVDVAGYDAVVLATGHDEFGDLSLDSMAADMNDDPVLVDVDGRFERHRAEEAGFAYKRL